MSIDTLALAHRLRDADLPTAQAEAVASAIGLAMLDGGAARTSGALQEMLDAKFERFRRDMLWANRRLFAFLTGTQLLLLTLVVAIIKLL